MVNNNTKKHFLKTTILESASSQELWNVLRIKYELPATQSLEETSISTLIDIMNTYYGDNASIKKNKKEWMSHVACAKTIREDNEALLNEDTFYWCPSELFSAFLSLRAGDGRAHSGHGMYKKKVETKDSQTRKTITKFLPDPKVNTTIDDIIRESGIDRFTFGKMSEESIHELVQPILTYLNNVEDVLTSDTKKETKILRIKELTSEFRLLDPQGNTIMGYPFLKYTHINPLEFMRGFYFASQMDNYEIRKKVTEKYGFEMGGGECYAVNKYRLMDFNITFEELASGRYKHWLFRELSHEKRMELFKELGIVIEHPVRSDATSFEELLAQGIRTGEHNNKLYVNSAYIREQRGAGVADDVAIVLASFLPPLHHDYSYLHNPELAWISRFMGAHFADLIDTMDKSMNSVLPGGIDEALGNMLNKRFKEIYSQPEMSEALEISQPHKSDDLVSKNVLMDYIAASANIYKRNDIDKKYSSIAVHSSARYFLREQYDLAEKSLPAAPSTCTLRELLAWTQDYLTKREMPFCEVLEHDSERGLFLSNELQVGFGRIPIHVVKFILSVSTYLVAQPTQREERIRNHFYNVLEKKEITS